MHLEFRVLGIAIHKASAKGGSCGDIFYSRDDVRNEVHSTHENSNGERIETRGRLLVEAHAHFVRSEGLTP